MTLVGGTHLVHNNQQQISSDADFFRKPFWTSHFDLGEHLDLPLIRLLIIVDLNNTVPNNAYLGELMWFFLTNRYEQLMYGFANLAHNPSFFILCDFGGHVLSIAWVTEHLKFCLPSKENTYIKSLFILPKDNLNVTLLDKKWYYLLVTDEELEIWHYLFHFG